ncbi:MAG: penicillin acylase family protein [Balneolaceae bacterium]
MSTVVRILLLILFLVIAFSAIALYQTINKTLPNYDTELQLSGLNEPVDVHRDPFGVPLIIASGEEDLFMAAGYIHAQERLWQMTLFQLMAEGRFAEFLGEELLPYDRHQRTIGIWETARQIEAQSPDSLLERLQWYANGVNAFVDENRRQLPLEFALLDVEPIRWTPTHSIAVSRLLAWNQNISWQHKMTYAALAGRVSQGVLHELTPAYRSGDPVLLTEAQTRALSAALPFLDREHRLRDRLGNSGIAVGSNAWAVQGSRTASGAPMLGGDPHMGLSIPGFWFELSYLSPTMTISGATIPGAPFVILGRNNRMAWSITNSMADDTDFYLEQLDEANERYVADSANGEAVYRDLQWRDEIIRVKNGDDRLVRIAHTHNGPLVDEELFDERYADPRYRVAMRWSGHRPGNELWAFYRMNRAETMPEFQAALEDFTSPVMSFIYADSSDNIALFTAGHVPVRSQPRLAFREGWNPAHDWQGVIPFQSLPRAVNPPRGFVAHSNNKLHGDSYPWYFSTFWEPPSRIARIEQVLGENRSVTLHHMQQLQNDVRSHHAAELTPVLLPLLRRVQQAQEFDVAITYFENWNYQYRLNSTAATLFDLFFINLSQAVLREYVDDELLPHLLYMEQIPAIVVRNLLMDSGSMFNIASEEMARTRDRLVYESMAATLDELRSELGTEPFEWRWESKHKLTLEPPLLGEAARDENAPAMLRMIVRNLFNRGPFAVTGHGQTVNKMEYRWDEPFRVTLGPSIRRIVDFSEPGRTHSVLPTGQSGHPLSQHYGDQTDLWLDGRYRIVFSDSSLFRNATIRTTRFLPDGR